MLHWRKKLQHFGAQQAMVLTNELPYPCENLVLVYYENWYKQIRLQSS